MLNLKNPEIKFALETVRAASLLVKIIQAEMVSSALTKEDRSPVTVADFAAQALVGHALSETYPQDTMIGEEDSASLRTPGGRETLLRITEFVTRFVPNATHDSVCSWIDHGSGRAAQRYWTLDPIDGTKGFLRGDQYAVALALVYDQQVQVGVLGCPKLTFNGREGVILAAARRQGTWCTPLEKQGIEGGYFDQVMVSSQSDPAFARLLRSFESGHTNIDQIDTLSSELGIQAEPVRMDSQAKYAVLAAGLGEIYLRLLSPDRADYREKIWDQAAGSIIIEEAGGRVTDLDGISLDFNQGRTLARNRGICATNGRLHEVTLEALKAIGA
jgi:3'(2'), 5'-bisphosphate nucleotidase